MYDPAEGEPTQGIAPRTAFEDLPDDWICPVRGSPKDMYEPM
jgi:rubredoxin